jgi:hypothetical protein
MADYKQRIFLVDPGIGEKSEICPYSQFEDGRDVTSYIIPPDGYEFTEFKLEPYDGTDTFYDGKIVAQYKELSFMDTIKPNFMRYIIAIVVAICVLVAVIMMIFKKPKTKVYIPAEVAPTEEQAANQVPEEPANNVVAYETVKEEAPVEQKVEESTPVAVPQVEVKEEAKEEVVQTPVKEEAVAEPQLSEAELKAQFKKEFWDLIHQKEKKMPVYARVYRAYKDQVQCEELSYMIKNILASSAKFQKWNAKLQRVPANEIKSINTIDKLKAKLEEYK